MLANTAREERALVRKTAVLLNAESYYCSIAFGKLAEVASVIGRDRAGTRIVKAVYDKIDRKALDKLLCFDELSRVEVITIEVWIWKRRARAPLIRKKLSYNRPNQPLNSHFKRYVK